jgi:transposase-like protein
MVARMNWTREWWQDHRPAYEAVTSPAVLKELMQHEHPQQAEKVALIQELPMLEINNEVLGIVETYIARKVMPQDAEGDALHLGLASFYGCDVLLTWNCAHLANFNKFAHIRRVNVALGLFVPQLLTPLELMQTVEDDEN